MKILLSLILLLTVVLSLSFSLDESALKLHDEALERSVVAFALAKGLNAVISLIQGTELSVTPLGLGLNISIGEILDPFNDMVERFSWVMLISSVSLGILKLLLILSSKIFLQVALLFSISLTLFFIWVKKMQNSAVFVVSFKILFLMFILRFGAVAFVYSSELFYNSMLHDEFVKSSKVIEKTKDKLDEIQARNSEIVQSKKDSSFFDNVSSKYNKLSESLNISTKLASLKHNIEDASANIINLITIFVVQTILLPLLFLWLFVQSIKFVFRFELDNHKIIRILV